MAISCVVTDYDMLNPKSPLLSYMLFFRFIR